MDFNKLRAKEKGQTLCSRTAVVPLFKNSMKMELSLPRCHFSAGIKSGKKLTPVQVSVHSACDSETSHKP